MVLYPWDTLLSVELCSITDKVTSRQLGGCMNAVNRMDEWMDGRSGTQLAPDQKHCSATAILTEPERPRRLHPASKSSMGH